MPRPNFIFIVADDMGYADLGCYGGRSGCSPVLDQMAAQGLRFSHAHVQVGNCMPSRNVMLSGRYPHNNGVEGFYQVKTARYPVLADLMKAGGYFTAIRGKVAHSTPYSPYPSWDMVLDNLDGGGRAHPKEAASYGESTRRGIEAAAKAGKPFCLVINVADPHKPFYAEGPGGQVSHGPPPRSATPTRGC